MYNVAMVTEGPKYLLFSINISNNRQACYIPAKFNGIGGRAEYSLYEFIRLNDVKTLIFKCNN